MMSTGKILVVDDDCNLLELIRTRLEAAKYEVVTAVKGEEAKAALNGDSIDLSIVDLKLAGQDGMSLMGELHAINPALPVSIITGRAGLMACNSPISDMPSWPASFKSTIERSMLSPLSAAFAYSPLTAVTTSYLAASSLVRTSSRRL